MENFINSNQFLKVDSLSIKFDDFYALNKVSFTLNKGDFVALIGANGAGKSTLLNSLYGLLKPTNGTITYNNAYLNPKQPAHSIGFSAQRLIIDWYLNVRENVYMGALLFGVKNSEVDKATRDAIELVHLSNKLEAVVESLSGVQQQRVQIARAIVHRPDLYILDEPTTGLDPALAEGFFEFLKEEQNKGKTIIISSHDMYLLEKYCNKVLFLQNGELVFFEDISSMEESTLRNLLKK